MKQKQKRGYFALGAVVIGIVAILIIYIVMIGLGLVQVTRNHIIVSTESANKLYDGEPLTADGWAIEYGELMAGHTVDAKVIGTQTDVGVSDNLIAITILDSQGADVTGKYEIEYQLGTLAVNGKRLEFQSAGAEKYYDGEPLSNPECTFVSGELMANHECRAYAVGEITNIGEAPNTISVTVIDTLTGEDVTKQYDVVKMEGTLKVSARRLVISGGVSGNIDGSTGDVEMDCLVVNGKLLDGHKIMYSPVEGNYEGINIDAMLVYVVDSEGNDVTELYEILYAGGDLSVKNPETYFPLNSSDMENTNPYKDLEGLSGLAGAAALEVPVYSVTASRTGAVYLRVKSWGDYDGNDWSDPNLYQGVAPDGFASSALQNAGKSTADITVTALVEGMPYALPYYYVSGSYAWETLNDCETQGSLSKGQSYLSVFTPYTYNSMAAYKVSADIAEAEKAYAVFVKNTYLGVDDETRKQLIAIAAENGIYAGDADIIAKVAEYIKNAADYDMEFSFSEDVKNGVVDFLTVTKKGVCRHFAASATLMYRSLGIPARYVTGFLAQAKAGQTVEVKAKQAHAWVEVYLDGFGWVQLEVTGDEASTRVPPSGLNGNDAMGAMPKDMTEEYTEVAEVLVRQKGGVYLRARSFGDFDGKNWGEATAIPEELGIFVTPYTVNLKALTAKNAVSRSMQIKMLAENYPYILPYFAQNYDFTSADDTQVYSDYTVGEDYTVQYAYYDYLTSGGVSVPSSELTVERAYAAFVDTQYLNVDTETAEYFQKKAAELGISGTGLDAVTAVAEYIKGAAVYDEDVGAMPSGVNEVIYFLDTSKAGICRHFATAATLMYRSIGIPARYTVGFYVESEGNRQTVYMSDAHAWVEVYIDRMGWIPIEVTAPKTPVAQQKTTLSIPTGSSQKTYDGMPLTNSNIYWDRISGGWSYDAATGICTNLSTGHWFDTAGVVATGSLVTVSEAGISNNVKGITVRDADGNDVTSEYSIVGSGKLIVDPITVTVTAKGKTITDADAEKYFNEFTYTVTADGEISQLLEGHTIVAEFTYDADNPVPADCVVENTIESVKIVDKNGTDVLKSYYKVVYGSHGMLEYV